MFKRIDKKKHINNNNNNNNKTNASATTTIRIFNCSEALLLYRDRREFHPVLVQTVFCTGCFFDARNSLLFRLHTVFIFFAIFCSLGFFFPKVFDLIECGIMRFCFIFSSTIFFVVYFDSYIKIEFRKSIVNNSYQL